MLRTCRWVSPPSFFAVPHLTQFFLSSCWLPSFFWLFFMSLHHGNNLTFHTLRFKKIISRKSIDSWRFYVFKVYHMYFKLLSYRKVHQRLPPLSLNCAGNVSFLLYSFVLLLGNLLMSVHCYFYVMGFVCRRFWWSSAQLSLICCSSCWNIRSRGNRSCSRFWWGN